MNGYGRSRYYQNPYYDRQFGPALSATRGFLTGMQQYQQMALNQQYRQSLMDLNRARIEHYEKGGANIKINIFDPSKFPRLEEAALSALDAAPTGTSHYSLWKWGDKPRVSLEDAQKAQENFRNQIGYYSPEFNEYTRQQADSIFERIARTGESSKARLEKEIEWPDGLFKPKPIPEPTPAFKKVTGEPSTGTFKSAFELEPDTGQTSRGTFTKTPRKSLAKQKSPYSDYPNAFLENGVWKVIRNGKKYRIEE